MSMMMRYSVSFPSSSGHRHAPWSQLSQYQESRYGPLNCSTAQGDLCHEAPAQPVTQPNRSSATGANRQLSGWLLPPLVTRALGAHSINLVTRLTPMRYWGPRTDPRGMEFYKASFAPVRPT